MYLILRTNVLEYTRTVHKITRWILRKLNILYLCVLLKCLSLRFRVSLIYGTVSRVPFSRSLVLHISPGKRDLLKAVHQRFILKTWTYWPSPYVKRITLLIRNVSLRKSVRRNLMFKLTDLYSMISLSWYLSSTVPSLTSLKYSYFLLPLLFHITAVLFASPITQLNFQINRKNNSIFLLLIWLVREFQIISKINELHTLKIERNTTNV